ncbi:MAG: polysaccharide biosynthesis/export family protein [Caulobacterales bacterium]
MPTRRLLIIALVALAPLVAVTRGHAGPHAAADFPNIGYATWEEDEPQYRIFPGDELDVTIPSAPELAKIVTVQPDGRISLPLIQPVMAADRTVAEVNAALTAAYASQLIHPEASVSVRAQPLKVFVGGEVDKPGVYDMPGDIDALRAIIEAGGAKPSGKLESVVIIRRGAGGVAMMRTVDLKRALSRASGAELVPLRRFDIIYVPRSGLGELAANMTLLRDALPIGFSYAITGRPF